VPYAIATVPEDWTTENPLGFSEAAYEKWNRSIEPGTRVLIFKGAPVNAVIAEAVVPDNVFQKISDWPQQDMHSVPRTAIGEAATYILPLRVLFTHGSQQHVPLASVREALGDEDFMGKEWLPIDHTTYDRLNTFPDTTPRHR
jgi:hypothetical protein